MRAIQPRPVHERGQAQRFGNESENQFFHGLGKKARVKIHAVDLPVDLAVRIHHRGLNQMVKTFGRGSKEKPKVSRQTRDGGFIGAQERPVRFVAYTLLARKAAHPFGRILQGVETNRDHIKSILPDSTAGDANGMRKVPGGGRTDVKATGVNQADNQRFTAKIRELDQPATAVMKRITGKRTPNGGLTDLQGGGLVEFPVA